MPTLENSNTSSLAIQLASVLGRAIASGYPVALSCIVKIIPDLFLGSGPIISMAICWKVSSMSGRHGNHLCLPQIPSSLALLTHLTSPIVVCNVSEDTWPVVALEDSPACLGDQLLGGHGQYGGQVVDTVVAVVADPRIGHLFP